uniref:Odorant receptor n=1 Tax=Aphidius gifuensis TaxID=684658 RepID=A0A3S9LWB5_APHGI|nr:odorant receptor [Aphidius gifuensis]
MDKKIRESLPIRLTKFYLFLLGFGTGQHEKQKTLLKLMYFYAVIALTIGGIVVIMDIYYCWNDFYEASYSLISFLSWTIVTIKFSVFSLKQKAYLQLMIDGKDKLWYGKFSGYENKIIKKCEKQSMMFIVLFTIMAQLTAITYALEPIIENNTRNLTDRLLPFKLWIKNIPFSKTPYYEFFFILEMCCVFYTSFGYFCFDNFLALYNIFITGKFEILNNKLETLYDIKKSQNSIYNNKKYITDINLLRKKFSACVKQHQLLIHLTEQLESVYSFINLIQTVLFSLLVCLVGYQLISPGIRPSRRGKFVIFLIGCLLQLFTFGHTCNNVNIASSEISKGTSYSKWYTINSIAGGRMLTKDLMFVILRSCRPCCLTGWGFFPITLDTFKLILNTAFSYLTLMRKSGKAST